MAMLSDNRLIHLVRLIVGIVLCAVIVSITRSVLQRSEPTTTETSQFSGAVFQITTFREIPRWPSDTHAEALGPFVRSCTTLEKRADDEPFNRQEGPNARAYVNELDRISGTVADWRPICQKAKMIVDTRSADSKSSSAERTFFEQNFTPVLIKSGYRKTEQPTLSPQPDRLEVIGKTTGYFEPTYEARSEPDSEFAAPLLARPEDLISVDLGAFSEDLKGRRLAGRLKGSRLVPFPARSDINAGALATTAKPLAYLRPNDLFFLQIQGSGKLLFENGTEQRVGYDGQNGRPYYAIGRSLLARGALTRETVSMQSIRAWLENAPPRDAQRLREENQSYVFFRTLNNLSDPKLGPLGAQGVQLSSRRSIAVDRSYHGLGTPVWLELQNQDESVQRAALYIAQDVGGAIKGPIRADIFVGSGDAAGEIAGRLNAEITMTVLLPKSVVDRLSEAGIAGF
ncbi:MAG: MltA domain-containing protein [Pseudomonadota bacterium]